MTNEHEEQASRALREAAGTPLIRVTRDIDECALAARLRRYLNRLDHNPTPGCPRQGRKRGQAKNRVTKRGKGKGKSGK